VSWRLAVGVGNSNLRWQRRGICREHSSKKWIRPRFSVDLIKDLQDEPSETEVNVNNSSFQWRTFDFFSGDNFCRNFHYIAMQLK
jgi:hypothetical protein